MYVHVKVKTGQKKEAFNILDENHFEISLREKAEKNLANSRILELIKKHFKVNKVRIINGHHSPSKLLSVDE